MSDGPGDGKWTPEDLLLGSVAGCFTIKCCDLAEGVRLQYCDLEVEVEGVVGPASSGRVFRELVIRANLTIPYGQDPEPAFKLLQKAQGECLISRILATPQILEPAVTVRGSGGLANHPGAELRPLQAAVLPSNASSHHSHVIG